MRFKFIKPLTPKNFPFYHPSIRYKWKAYFIPSWPAIYHCIELICLLYFYQFIITPTIDFCYLNRDVFVDAFYPDIEEGDEPLTCISDITDYFEQIVYALDSLIDDSFMDIYISNNSYLLNKFINEDDDYPIWCEISYLNGTTKFLPFDLDELDFDKSFFRHLDHITVYIDFFIFSKSPDVSGCSRWKFQSNIYAKEGSSQFSIIPDIARIQCDKSVISDTIPENLLKIKKKEKLIKMNSNDENEQKMKNKEKSIKMNSNDENEQKMNQTEIMINNYKQKIKAKTEESNRKRSLSRTFAGTLKTIRDRRKQHHQRKQFRIKQTKLNSINENQQLNQINEIKQTNKNKPAKKNKFTKSNQFNSIQQNKIKQSNQPDSVNSNQNAINDSNEFNRLNTIKNSNVIKLKNKIQIKQSDEVIYQKSLKIYRSTYKTSVILIFISFLHFICVFVRFYKATKTHFDWINTRNDYKQLNVLDQIHLTIGYWAIIDLISTILVFISSVLLYFDTLKLTQFPSQSVIEMISVSMFVTLIRASQWLGGYLPFYQLIVILREAFMKLVYIIISILPIVTGLSLFGIFLFGYVEDSYQTFRYLVQRMITSGMGDSIDDFFIITDDGTEATVYLGFLYVGVITALGMWIVFTSCIATVSYVHQNYIVARDSYWKSSSDESSDSQEAEIRNDDMIVT